MTAAVANGKPTAQQTAATAPESTAQSGNLFDRLMKIPELQVLFCAISIIGCYSYYGVLHEKIMKTDYDGERFGFPIFLVFLQCCVNSLCAGFMLLVNGERRKDTTPHKSYAIVSLAYLSAMVFSFSALKHMSYPMQVLGKSCKMIPVMIMGVLVAKRKYSLKEYCCVFLITLGVALFSYKPKAAGGGHTSTMGLMLLGASLACDGFTGPYQERIVKAHNPSSHQLMFWQNLWAVIWLLAANIISGEGLKGIEFITAHPNAVYDILLFCLTSAVGQNFIFYTVRNISALTCTTITTTRKFFTLLVSLIYYKHSLNARQGSAIVLVFSGIIWETVMKFQAKQARKAAEKLSAEQKTAKTE